MLTIRTIAQHRLALITQSRNDVKYASICIANARWQFALQPYDHEYGMNTGTSQTRHFFIRKKRSKIYRKVVVFPKGDLVQDLPDVEHSQIKPGFKSNEELESANETVKQLFSIGYSDGRTVLQHRIDKLVGKVQNNSLDTKSLEVQVTSLTVLIRNLMKHVLEFRTDVRNRDLLEVRILCRNYLLGQLRQRDADRYKWLCEELQLEYKPLVHQWDDRMWTKRALRKKAARDVFINEKKLKMAALQSELNTARKAFDEKKEVELTELEEEMRDLGVEDTSSMESVFKSLGLEHMLDTPTKVVWRRRLMLQRKFALYGDDIEASRKIKNTSM